MLEDSPVDITITTSRGPNNWLDSNKISFKTNFHKSVTMSGSRELPAPTPGI